MDGLRPQIEEAPSSRDRTVLELLAKSPMEFITFDQGPRPLQSTPTQQRTFDPAANRPDSVPDVATE
jgi:hypothetical protein